MNKLRYKAAIFDMDGTVLDTLDELTISLNHIFAVRGRMAVSKEDVRQCLGYGYAGLIERTASDAGAAEKEALIHAFKEYYTSHCQGHTYPYAGIAEMLEQLKAAGSLNAIVSNKGQRAVTALHEEFFSNTVAFALGETPNLAKKPAPDMIREALRRLDCRPDEAVYIGDSEVDELTADNAGLPVVLVTWGFRDRSFLQRLRPAALADAPDELLTYLLPPS